MYEIQIDLDQLKGTIKLTGELTVRNATQIRGEILNLLNQVESIVINQSDCDEFDLAYLQILDALKNSADSSGKKIEIQSGSTEQFLNMLDDFGYTKNRWLKECLVDKNTLGVQNA